jgi:hypothetical protein
MSALLAQLDRRLDRLFALLSKSMLMRRRG